MKFAVDPMKQNANKLAAATSSLKDLESSVSMLPHGVQVEREVDKEARWVVDRLSIAFRAKNDTLLDTNIMVVEIHDVDVLSGRSPPFENVDCQCHVPTKAFNRFVLPSIQMRIVSPQ